MLFSYRRYMDLWYRLSSSKKVLSLLILAIAIIGMGAALLALHNRQNLRQFASTDFTCAINPNQTCSSQTCAQGQAGSGSCQPGTYCCLQNNSSQLPVIEFAGQMTQNSNQGNPNLLSRIFIFLNTKGEAIKNVSFTLNYPPQIINNNLFVIPQAIFPAQNTTNSKAVGQVDYSITNTSSTGNAVNTDIAVIYFQNMVSPVSTALEVTHISVTQVNGNVQAIPDTVSPIFTFQ